MRSWDWSQIENFDEEESWQEGDQMAALWEEEQKLKEIMERRRMEGSSLQLDAMQRVQELVLNERMLQGKRVKSLKEKKKIPRWRRVRKNKNIKTRKCGEDYFFLLQSTVCSVCKANRRSQQKKRR